MKKSNLATKLALGTAVVLGSIGMNYGAEPSHTQSYTTRIYGPQVFSINDEKGKSVFRGSVDRGDYVDLRKNGDFMDMTVVDAPPYRGQHNRWYPFKHMREAFNHVRPGVIIPKPNQPFMLHVEEYKIPVGTTKPHSPSPQSPPPKPTPLQPIPPQQTPTQPAPELEIPDVPAQERANPSREDLITQLHRR